MDWERVRYFACALVSGGKKEDLARQGYFIEPTDEEAWNEALSDPSRYADEEVESDIGVCAPLPPEILAYFLGDEVSKAGFGGNRSEAGRFAAQQRWKNHQKAQPQQAQPKADVVTDNPDEALNALRQGKTVSLGNVQEVNTLIEKVHEFAQEAKKKGEKTKLNLCQVSVPGTNLFCGSSLKGEDGKPIPRDKMPQLAGKPKKGSPVDDPKKFPVDEAGEVNVGDASVKHLAEKGIATKEGSIPAAKLKASQSELKGANLAFMMSPEGQKAVKLHDNSIFVSSDGYVIDGHHRWAALVGLDAKDGKLGQTPIKVRVIDMPIKDVLTEANAFTSVMGIEAKSA